MVSVVAELDQTLPAACEDVKTTDPPSQNVVAPPALIVGADGKAFTVNTPVDGVLEHVPSVTTTV